MINKHLLILFIIFLGVNTTFAQKIQIITTTENERWVNMTKSVNKKATLQKQITIFTDSLLQKIDGFGGTFNELGWDALQNLSSDQQKEVIQSLFGSEGINFPMARTPIGASDYALSYYSYCDVKEDYTMRDFNISRDKYILIPYIKEALKNRPDLKIWASPWTPPAWMKINEHYTLQGGNIAGRTGGNEMDTRKNIRNNATAFNMQTGYLQAYALYFSKYIQEYKKEGINIWAIMPQNEIAWSPNWPCCTWRAHDLAHFIGKYLGPQLQTDQLQTEIWLGTINYPNPDYVRDIIKERDASEYIKGIGFQWSGKESIPFIKKEYPQLQYMQTENTCGEHENDWSSVENTWQSVLHYFKNGANSFMYWNMILDETGKSSWGWAQNSLVIINRQTKKIKYTDEYFLMKHLSHFIQPGAHLLRTSDMDTILAFKLTNDNIAIVICNTDKTENNLSLNLKDKIYDLNLPSKSINTILLSNY